MLFDIEDNHGEGYPVSHLMATFCDATKRYSLRFDYINCKQEIEGDDVIWIYDGVKGEAHINDNKFETQTVSIENCRVLWDMMVDSGNWVEI